MDERPYVVAGRRGRACAFITDRRDGTTRRWTLHRDARIAGRRCANCGAPLTCPYYRPPLMPQLRDRLCVACVAGAEAGAS